jgi:hypothetical protein
VVARIVGLVRHNATEQWLIIHQKTRPGERDLVAEIRGELDSDLLEQLEFISWGTHTGTNKFSAIPNVIFAGLLNLPASAYEARLRAACEYSPEVLLPPETLRRFTFGEHAHDVLQAAGRGAMRQCLNGACAPSRIYLIAPFKSGIPQQLPEIFPGCQRTIFTADRAVDSDVDRAIKMLRSWRIRFKPGDTITFSEVAKRLGMTARAFRDRVRRRQEFEMKLPYCDVGYCGAGERRNKFIALAGRQ